MKLKRSLGKMMVALFLFAVLAAPVFAQDTINIVMLDPLSGPFKNIGDRWVMGVQFAVDQVNAAGGILGKKIKLLPEDGGKPDVAVRKATKAILEDNVKFMFTGGSTGVTRALMDVAEKHKVIFVTFGTESDFLTGKDFNRYFFRTCFTTKNRSRVYAEFFKTKPWRKFYLINMDYAFGHAVADDFKSEVKKVIPDLKIVGEDFHPFATKDFGPYITKILASGAEIIYTGNWGTDQEVLIKQGAQMGVKARYATYFLDDDIELANIGQAAVGSFVTSTYMPTIDTPQNKAFMEAWNKKYKGTKHPWPTRSLGYGVNGASFFFEAVRKAKSFDTETIIKTWEGMEYVGLIGKQTMRACDHQAIMDAPIAEIQAQSNLFPFPFPGKPTIIPKEKVAVPPQETGNPRCK